MENHVRKQWREGDLIGMMARMMSKMEEMDARIENRMKESNIHNQATQNTLVEKIKALKMSRSSRYHTPRSESLHRQAPDMARLVSRGDDYYREYVENGYGGNDDGRYEDYKCYGGYSRGEYDRGNYESSFHGDGLDRENRRELVSRHHEHLNNTMRNEKHHEHLRKEREREREIEREREKA